MFSCRCVSKTWMSYVDQLDNLAILKMFYNKGRSLKRYEYSATLKNCMLEFLILIEITKYTIEMTNTVQCWFMLFCHKTYFFSLGKLRTFCRTLSNASKWCWHVKNVKYIYWAIDSTIFLCLHFVFSQIIWKNTRCIVYLYFWDLSYFLYIFEMCYIFVYLRCIVYLYIWDVLYIWCSLEMFFDSFESEHWGLPPVTKLSNSKFPPKSPNLSNIIWRHNITQSH